MESHFALRKSSQKGVRVRALEDDRDLQDRVLSAWHGAKLSLQALRDLVDQQAPSRSDGVGATFGQLLDQWLEECERIDLAPTTIRTYRAQIKRTIRPNLGR